MLKTFNPGVSLLSLDCIGTLPSSKVTNGIQAGLLTFLLFSGLPDLYLNQWLTMAKKFFSPC